MSIFSYLYRRFFPFCKKNLQGSALLTSLLFISLLLLITVGLSELVMRQIRRSEEFGRILEARYAAEAALESALLDLKLNEVGFEHVEDAHGTSDDDLRYVYRIFSKTHQIPTLDPDIEPLLSEIEKYAVLEYNQSVVIPLFSSNDGGDIDHVRDFRVEFFPNFQTLPQGVGLKDLDVLRWKILGISESTQRTDSINDFIAGGSGDPEQPTCFGTYNSDSSAQACLFDQVSQPFPIVEQVQGSDGDVYTVKLQDCQWNQAREYYDYSIDDVFTADCYPVADFLEKHSKNYLVLSNLVNVDVFEGFGSAKKQDLARIFYRVKTFDAPTVRDTLLVHADGFSEGSGGTVQKSYNLALKRESFLPVFHFAFYRTDIDHTSVTDQDIFEQKFGLDQPILSIPIDQSQFQPKNVP